MNEWKQQFAVATDRRTLNEALAGADVFVGLSVAGAVKPEMLKAMAERPIILALANPDPEIPYDEAVRARPDAIVATGRSDFPNQVNNVLGFPFIFRGALDARATTINDEMKLAATRALADLAREDVPDSVVRTYGLERLAFGPEYIIPKPFDPRVLVREAWAVAKAAMDSGVARRTLDLDEYYEQLVRRQGRTQGLMRMVIHKARRAPQRIVFPEGEEPKILRASHILIHDQIAAPILLGNEGVIRQRARELNLNLDAAHIVDPAHSPQAAAYSEELHGLRQRKGVTAAEAHRLVALPNYFAAMMLHRGDADVLVAGLTKDYSDVIRPALHVLPLRAGLRRVAGLHLMMPRDGTLYFFADTTVNIEPDAEDLAEIALMAADTAGHFNVTPRVAMLSFSNFGSTRHPLTEKVRRAVEIVRQRAPGLMVDGEMQGDTAVTPAVIESTYPFSTLRGGANVLIFPNLEAANTAYTLVSHIGGTEAIGPILMGLSKPVHVLRRNAEVNDIVNLAAIAVVEAQQTVTK